MEIFRQIDTWAIHEGHHFGHTVRVDLYRMSDPVGGIALLLRSDFVEAIQHFAARPQHCSTPREDQESGHFLIPRGSRNKLCGCFSIEEFRVELPDALAPVLVFAEFCLCYDTVSFFFQGIHLGLDQVG